MPQVKVIQPIAEQAKKLQVAAYARVSSDSADQLNSFATQVGYYTSLIQSKDEWEFAGLYADEAVSGTTADKRDDFQRLLADCRAGKVDRILVKSISRFARNTIDCLQTVRELKQLGVAVEFEKEGLDTGNMGSEMLLSILGSAAQEESLSISKNLKWSYQRRMKSGDFITCSAPIGYFLENGTLMPNLQEVPIVEYIFSNYLAGKSIEEIVEEINSMEVLFTHKKSSKWYYSVVRYMLSNEKYIGDSLVQKKFTTDELPLKRIKNLGQLPKFYIKNSHSPIISKDIFNSVQILLKSRNRQHAPKRKMEQAPLSNLMQCGQCGSKFHKHMCNGEICWLCAQHRKSRTLCPMPILHEREVYNVFLTVYNTLLDNQQILKRMLDQLLELQTRTTLTRPDAIGINEAISQLVEQNHSLTRLRTKGFMDSTIYIERNNRNNQKIGKLRQELRQLQDSNKISSVVDSTKMLLDLLEGTPPMLDFEPSIFKSMVQKIVIYPERFCFYLTNGLILDEGRYR